ncbi:ROK family transcriptional regulator [Arcanobacterium haemolyticum]|nr:ROK family transcriptional regulator [Arcanobacterium haemolyticum]
MGRTNSDIDVLELIVSGRASTRADIARTTGLAPSTITGIVTRLVRSGAITEGGTRESTGGRPGSILVPVVSTNRSVVAELGAHHIHFGLADNRGVVTNQTHCAIDISHGPQPILEKLLREGEKLAKATDTTLTALGIAIPGPVDAATGTIIGPSRMPGWNGCNIPQAFSELTDLPVVVENDARIGASGEYAYRRHIDPRTPLVQDYIYVKAGSAIGGAFVQNGVVYSGSRGIAGDITHVRVEAGLDRPCQCGNTGCLDTIASATAVRADLRDQGIILESNSDLITAALDGNPEVVTAIRHAGVVLGEALARNVSFLAPQALIIGGTLSSVDAYTAGVRQALHEQCLHSIVEHFVVERSLAGKDAALWGLADAILVHTTPRSTS